MLPLASLHVRSSSVPSSSLRSAQPAPPSAPVPAAAGTRRLSPSACSTGRRGSERVAADVCSQPTCAPTGRRRQAPRKAPWLLELFSSFSSAPSLTKSLHTHAGTFQGCAQRRTIIDNLMAVLSYSHQPLPSSDTRHTRPAAVHAHR